MALPVNILDSAKHDLVAIRKKVTEKFGYDVWKNISLKYKEAFKNIGEFPLLGSIPDEIEALGMTNIRQVLLNQTRIVYQIANTALYIHMCVDTKQNFQQLLYDRALRKLSSRE